MRFVRASASVLALAATAGLTACSGSGATVANTSVVPTPAAVTTSASAAPTSTAPSVATTGLNVLPGATPPVIPAAAKAETPVGAQQFAAAVIDAVDWAYSTTDSTILRRYYAQVCDGCANSYGVFDRTKAAGHHFVGGHLTLHSVGLVNAGGHDVSLQKVDVTVSAAKLLTNNAKNVVIYRDAALLATVEYTLKWTLGAWRVTSIVFVKTPASG